MTHAVAYISFIGYIDELFDETVKVCEEQGEPTSLQRKAAHPESLCSGYDRPSKCAADEKHKSRFILH